MPSSRCSSLRAVQTPAAFLALLAAGAVAPAGVTAAAPGPLAKVESALLDLRADPSRSQGLALGRGGRVWVDVYLKGGLRTATSALAARGLRVADTARHPFRIVEGTLPIDSLEEVAALSSVRAVAAVYPGGVDTGSVTSEGDGAHRGPEARAIGPNGAGVPVGVISDSINQVGGGVADSQASGDLPADVRVLKDDATGVDEGRAMAEVIYDGAPGIPTILFASGTEGGAVGKADSINQLVAAGARVIADDIFYLSEPFFQDGTVSLAAQAARQSGVAYLASAGNRGRQSYEATYSDADGLHDFDPGPGVDTEQTLAAVPGSVEIPLGGSIAVVLQWDERWGGAETDLDLFLHRADTGLVVAASTSDNLATGLPRETVSFVNPAPVATEVYLRIQRKAGTRSPFMKYIFQDNFQPTPVPEFATQSDTINPDAASAPGVLATAAVYWAEPGLNDAEPFSSRGPKERLFDAAGTRLAAPEKRAKPEIAAADGVSTSVPGFAPFLGTSAAVPSAAGIAALILSAKATNTADDVAAILQSPANAIDCLAEGRPDADCGIGFLLADVAVRQASDTTPPTVSADISPPPDGRAGFYRSAVPKVTWTAVDEESPVSSLQGCDPVTVDTDTPPAGVTLTCTARSAGGTATGEATVKRDSTPPVLSRLAAARRRVRFRLTERARVSIRIERRRRGRFRRVRGITAAAKAGGNSVRIRGRRLRRGRYRLRVRATDPAGNASPLRGKRFRVRR